LARPTDYAAGLLLAALGTGCPQQPPAPASSPPADQAAPPARDAAVAEKEPEEASSELGLLRQPRPLPPAEGPVYAVADFPTHTPPLQEGTEDDRNLVLIYCVGCHSTTYISNQPALPRARWEAEVKKMIHVYGAAIPEPIGVRIATYLHSYYGDGPPPPRKPSAAKPGATPTPAR
jgi:hypothetical protein